MYQTYKSVLWTSSVALMKLCLQTIPTLVKVEQGTNNKKVLKAKKSNWTNRYTIIWI